MGRWVLGLGLGFMMVPAVMAAPLTVGFVDVVEPDAALIGFLQTLVATASAGAKDTTYAAIDAMVAPQLVGFGRGLDPLTDWNWINLSGEAGDGGFATLANHMLERGDFAEGQVPPDDRGEMLALIVALVANPTEPFGTMPEMGGAVCSPARIGYDRSAARRFAEAAGSDGGAITFYSEPIALRDEPEVAGPVVTTLAPQTLLIADYDQQADGWTKVSASDGTTGWMEARSDYVGLSQQHLCFGRVNGEYRVVGFFTYGL